MKFRRKPVIIEAAQWFKGGDHPAVELDGQPEDERYGVRTPGGAFTCVHPGEWVATDAEGKVKVMPIEELAAEYDPVAQHICIQHDCFEPAAFVYDWPGQKDNYACTEHAAKVREISKAMGMHNPLRTLR